MSELTESRLAAILDDAGVGGAVGGYEALGGGTYNSLYRVRLDGGRRLILKLPPETGTPCLTYERRLLVNEGEFYGAARGVPVPEVVHRAAGSLLVSEVPGEPWAGLVDRLGRRSISGCGVNSVRTSPSCTPSPVRASGIRPRPWPPPTAGARRSPRCWRQCWRMPSGSGPSCRCPWSA